MKYAVLSDVHGNYPALRAVMEDAVRQSIDHFLFAGDYCISGPWPDECISALRAIPEKTVIRGNEEKYLENLIGKDPSQWTDGQMQVSYWCYRNISKENLEYVLSLPHTADLECSGIKIHMAHSSVDFLGTHTFYTWNSATIAERIRQKDAGPEEILAEITREREQDPAFREAVSKLENGVYIFGHSHVQWSCQAKDRGVYLINPGSCGLPLDGIRDVVPYTVLEITEDGLVKIEEKRVPFDKAAYIRAFITGKPMSGAGSSRVNWQRPGNMYVSSCPLPNSMRKTSGTTEDLMPRTHGKRLLKSGNSSRKKTRPGFPGRNEPVSLCFIQFLIKLYSAADLLFRRMPFGNAAQQFEGPEGIVAPASVRTDFGAVFPRGNLTDRIQERTLRRALGIEEKYRFILQQVFLRVFQELLRKAAVINPGSKTDPVISGQVCFGLRGDVDQGEFVFRRDGIEKLLRVSVML